MSDSLHIELNQGVAILTLARPARRNALSRELLAAIRAALGEVLSRSAHAVVIAGEGVCFSAGADLAEIEGTAADVSFDDAVSETVAAIRRAPVAVLAAIEGACVGAALDVALACDARVASETSFFEIPAVRLGILYNPAAVARMRQILPATTLTRLMLLGERIEGREGLEAGIASHIARSGQTVELAKQIGGRLASAPAQALSSTKQFLVSLYGAETDVRHWQAVRIELLGSPERRQAVDRAKARPSV